MDKPYSWHLPFPGLECASEPSHNGQQHYVDRPQLHTCACASRPPWFQQSVELSASPDVLVECCFSTILLPCRPSPMTTPPALGCTLESGHVAGILRAITTAALCAQTSRRCALSNPAGAPPDAVCSPKCADLCWPLVLCDDCRTKRVHGA
jgi:hypothetical protein